MVLKNIFAKTRKRKTVAAIINKKKTNDIKVGLSPYGGLGAYNTLYTNVNDNSGDGDSGGDSGGGDGGGGGD